MDSAAEENSTASDAEKVLAEDITEAQVVDYLFAKHPNVEGCFATNSEAMELVLTETEDLAETKDLHMVGFDVTDTVLEAVQDGRIDGLIVQNPFGMGYAAVVASARAALNMGNEANVDTGYTWVSSENLEDDSVQQILY
jgi:ribose transport system substrate-binding protein